MPTVSSDRFLSRRVAAWVVTLGIATTTIQLLGSGSWVHRILLGAFRATPVPDSFDDLSGLVYRTDQLTLTPPSSGTREIFLTGSSVMGFWVRVPALQWSLEQSIPETRFRVENFWAQNATLSDTLLWVQQLPAGRPSTLYLGVYFKSFQPRMRKPFIARAFPTTNSALFRALFVSRTSDARARWDPNSDSAPTDGFWPAAPWSPTKGTGQAEAELLPIGPFPENDETRALADLVDLCARRGTRLVVIRTPINPAFRAAYRTLVPYAEYDAWLESLASRVTVWNLEDAIGAPDSFVDMQHPVAAGRDAFTRILAERSIELLRPGAAAGRTSE